MRPLTVPLTTQAIEEVLRRNGIKVIASGNTGQSMKFYFYGRQATGPAPTAVGDVWFLIELVLVPGGAATCTVKAENAQAMSLDRFSSVFWQALSNYVV